MVGLRDFTECESSQGRYHESAFKDVFVIRKIFIALGCLSMMPLASSWGQTVLTVAAYPAVDEIIKSSLPEWQKRNPQVQVQVKVVSREYSDHHTAMTTALAASSGLPDVMTIENGYLGRFSHSGGLENLAAPPYQADRLGARFVAYAWEQGRHDKHGQTAIPTDIGPGVMFFRVDLLDRSGVKPQQLQGRWDDFVQAGKQIKSKTGAHLVAHARDIKDIVIRSDLRPGEGLYYNEQGQSLVNSSPRFKRAFELALLVRQEGLDARVNAWSNEWGEVLKRGRVSVQMMGVWLGGTCRTGWHLTPPGNGAAVPCQRGWPHLGAAPFMQSPKNLPTKSWPGI